MHIHLRNNPATFNADQIWNNGALGFFVSGQWSPQQEQEQHEAKEQDE